jgi:8-oxo-dGTP pyrophosphatase MutT (NUDIX family)
MPITSYGIVCFRYNQKKEPEFLMIRRKDTLGYIDFMRGKYLVQNKQYIMNMLKQMTDEEKEGLRKGNFDTLWRNLWGDNYLFNKYKLEEMVSRDKFNLLVSGILSKSEFYNLQTLIDESNQYETWDEPEWGFPKGRRNYQEKDYDCAVREFCEETGYSGDKIRNIQNIFPMEEIFTGSNYKSYKHKYYVTWMNYFDSETNPTFESMEVSKMEWKTFDECIENIRPYNVEKKRMITSIYKCIKDYDFFLV